MNKLVWMLLIATVAGVIFVATNDTRDPEGPLPVGAQEAGESVLPAPTVGLIDDARINGLGCHA